MLLLLFAALGGVADAQTVEKLLLLRTNEATGEQEALAVRPIIDPITGGIILQPGYGDVSGDGDLLGGGSSNADSNLPARNDTRRFAAVDDTARAVGFHAGAIFRSLVRMLAALGIFALSLLLAVLACAYLTRVLLLLGVKFNYIIGAVMAVTAVLVVAGAWIALQELGVDPNELVIGLGLASIAAVKVVGTPFTEISNGFFVKINPSYDIGQEITFLSGRYRGIIHSKELTEIVIDLSSPLIASNPELAAVERGEPVAMSVAAVAANQVQLQAGRSSKIAVIVNTDYLRVSYSKFLDEERVWHDHHTVYVPRPLLDHRSMGVDMGELRRRGELKTT